MKCELCHKADAETAIRRGDGDDDELYVCGACAKAERQRRQKNSQRIKQIGEFMMIVSPLPTAAFTAMIPVRVAPCMSTGRQLSIPSIILRTVRTLWLQ